MKNYKENSGADGRMRTFGIDVSRWQGEIDWKAVVSDPKEVDFAIIKASQGGSEKKPDFAPYPDPKFRRNIAEASENYLNIGVYHYLTSVTASDVRKEADYLLSLIEPYRKKINLFAALDFEDADGFPKYARLGRKRNTELIRTFCDRIAEAGYTPCLYSNKNFLENYIDQKMIPDLPIWYARWGQSEQTALSEQPGLTAWQFGTTRIDGIAGETDADFYYFPDEGNEKDENENGDGEKEGNTVRYDTLEEIAEKLPYAEKTIKKLIDRGWLRGGSGGKLGLSEDMIRMFVVNDRAGVYENSFGISEIRSSDFHENSFGISEIRSSDFHENSFGNSEIRSSDFCGD